MTGVLERKVTLQPQSGTSWITVEKTVLLKRSDPVKQLLLEFFSDSSEEMSPETFLVRLDGEYLGEDYPMQNVAHGLVYAYVSPKFIYNKVGKLLQRDSELINCEAATALFISLLEALIEPLTDVGLKREPAICHCKLGELMSCSIPDDSFLCTLESVSKETATTLQKCCNHVKVTLKVHFS